MMEINLLHIAIWVFACLVIGLGLTYWEFHKQFKEQEDEEKNANAKNND